MAAAPANPHYTLDTLADGVHAAIARDGGAAIGNAGLIDLGDSTLVVDTFLTPTAAEALREDARRLTGRVPRWVVNTHYHNDHIWGNQVFLPEAEIISTVRTLELIQTAGQEEYDDYKSISAAQLEASRLQVAAATTNLQRANANLMVGYFGALVKDFPRLQVSLPGICFEHRLVLHGSKRRVELIEFRGAHTGSDTVVYLPEDGIVFMSDLLFIGYHPYMADGDTEIWLDVLQSILADKDGMPNAARFVPGHGPTGARRDLEQLSSYIRTTQELALALPLDGKSTGADIASAPVPQAYANWMLTRFFYANLGFLARRHGMQTGASVPTGRFSDSSRPGPSPS